MRYLLPHIEVDLKKKMVFLGGPRQVGKTTLTQQLLKNRRGCYFNWDDDGDRRHIISRDWSGDDELIVFDELHKFRRWKNWVKGVFDTQRSQHQFLVTGSARLDVYRRGGDSLMGRYHHWRLHPFTLSELPAGISRHDAFRRLMTVGGFPEPFLVNDERSARRWRKERFDRILKDDIRDLEPLRDIQTLSLFVEALRSRVGSTVVLSNIADDLQVAQKTLSHWLEVLERMYLVFVVRPFTGKLARAIKKPPKIYFFDNADVIGDDGARFENLVATHLLKELQFLEDRDGYRYELRFVRDKEGREVDFVVLRDGAVMQLIEVKLSKADVDPSLVYFAERLNPREAKQVISSDIKSSIHKGIRVQSVLDAFIPMAAL